MSIWSVVLAAGKGSRLTKAGLDTKKQYIGYQGVPLFWHSARTLSRHARMDGLVFVFPPDEVEEMREVVAELAASEDLGLPWEVTAGGKRRQDSVRNGLAALPRTCCRVLVHDSARPFANAEMNARLVSALESGDKAVIPGIAVSDTIKMVDDAEMVTDTPVRAHLRAVQTPQAFDLDTLVRVHEQAEAEGWEVTDDAMMCEKAGLPVRIVEGDALNIKITNPEDLKLLSGEEPMAPIPVTGFGYDVHKYVADGRPMILGGIPIAGAPNIKAHSDGDVLLHALTDAILGCLGMGDIGHHFPDTDPQFDGANSGVLLDKVLELAIRNGLRLHHADLTIIAQTPKLAPHRDRIRKNVAALLKLPLELVNVKATTEEGLGFTGEKKGIKAVAVVTAQRPAPENL